MSDWNQLRASAIDEGDDHLVLNKPTGIAVQGERVGDDISTLARRAGAWVMPAHRIDKPVSGVVLFARNREAHRHFTNQFRHGRADKAYLAVIRAGLLPARGTIDLALRDGRKGTVRVAGPRAAIAFDPETSTWRLPASGDPTGTTAVTRYETIAASDTHQLLLVTPVNGRRHQIRVHLAWIGAAIVGDPLFETATDTRLLLHAWQLSVDGPDPEVPRFQWTAPPGGDFTSLLARWHLRFDAATTSAGRPPPAGT